MKNWQLQPARLRPKLKMQPRLKRQQVRLRPPLDQKRRLKEAKAIWPAMSATAVALKL